MTNFFLRDIAYLKDTSMSLSLVAKILIVPVLLTATISSYKYYRMKTELDRKYTAIYLKSRGRL